METYLKIKCSNPECNEQFKLYEIKYPFLNDYGWIEIKCNKCGSCQKINVKNPLEYQHGTFPNAEIIDFHEYEEGEEKDNSTHPECALVVSEENNTVEWKPLASNPFWQVGVLNELNYTEKLTKSMVLIKRGISDFFNYYLAGQYRADLPRKIIVVQHISKNKITWAKTIDRECDFNTDNLYLINCSKQKEWPDGVYNRDTLLVYLERCLMRWKLLANQVVVVTPFIGFQYKSKKAQENVLGLWHFLNDRLDMSKTYFVTRGETRTLLKKNQAEIDIPSETLAEWHLMDELQRVVEDQKIKTKARFHAKFYAGIFNNHVEVLAGSYNIHTGCGLEQVSMKNYNKDVFKNKYMDNLVDQFDYYPFIDEDILLVEVDFSKIIKCDVIKMSEVVRIID